MVATMAVDPKFLIRRLPLPFTTTILPHLPTCISMNVVMLTRRVARPLPFERRPSLVVRAPNPRCLTTDRLSTRCLSTDRLLRCLITDRLLRCLATDRLLRCLITDCLTRCLATDRLLRCLIYGSPPTMPCNGSSLAHRPATHEHRPYIRRGPTAHDSLSHLPGKDCPPADFNSTFHSTQTRSSGRSRRGRRARYRRRSSPDPTTFNLQRFNAHVDRIISKLAKTIPLSDSCRSSILTEAEEHYIIATLNDGLKRRDMKAAVHAFNSSSNSHEPRKQKRSLRPYLASEPRKNENRTQTYSPSAKPATAVSRTFQNHRSGYTRRSTCYRSRICFGTLRKNVVVMVCVHLL
jgi:hypothetical protein